MEMAKIRNLHPDLQEVACQDLNEKPEDVALEIENFRQWIEEQPHLKTRMDDQYLVAFLRFCKYDQEKARRRIDYYYTYRTIEKDLLKSRSVDEDLLTIVRSGIVTTLPKPQGPGGPRIHFTRMGKINPSIHTVQEIFRLCMFRAELYINTDDNWIISGVLEIIDFSRIPYSFLKQFEVGLFRRMNNFLEHGAPADLKGTHIVGASKEAQFVLTLVRHCMKQKELLHIHPTLESLQKAIGIEYLPREYGGNNGTLDDAVATFEKRLIAMRDYFDEDENFAVEEKLRPPGKCETDPTTTTTTPTTTSTLTSSAASVIRSIFS